MTQASRLRSRAVLGARLRVGLALGLGALALHLGACGVDEAAPGDVGENDGGAGMGGSENTAPTLLMRLVSREDGHDLDAAHVKAASQADVVVTVMPPTERQVRFALLPAADAPLDAALDMTDADVDQSSGEARVLLTMPSVPTTFTVRASMTGATAAFLDLTVEKTGIAMLAVSPSYGGGRSFSRPGAPAGTVDLVASAYEDRSCAQLVGSPPEDGPAMVEATHHPVLLPVPADKPLAVILRAQRYTWGCTTLNAASEGGNNDIEVVMADVPMTLDKSRVDFALTLDDFTPYAQALDAPQQALMDAMLGNATDDVEALLDAMEGSLSDDAAFHATRGAEDWDANLRSALGATAAEALRAPLGVWLDTGVADMAASDGILARLEGKASAPPALTLESVFGLDPGDTSFVVTGEPSWRSGANDSLLIDFTLAFEPATLLLAAAKSPALETVKDSESLAGALAGSVCPAVAETLVLHGESPKHSTDGCDRTCTETLCESGVTALLAAAAAPGKKPATLAVALAGSGTVGDNAELVSFGGPWLGHLAMSNVATSLTGRGATLAPTAK